MGVSASITRKLDRVTEKDFKSQKENDEFLSKLEFDHQENVFELQGMISELRKQLKITSAELKVCQGKLEKEKKQNKSIFYSDLPMLVMKEASKSSEFSKTYPLVTVAQCNVVNFPSLTSILTPQDVVTIIDKLQAAIDEVLRHDDIFIMERHTDGCIAISGIIPYEEIKRNKTADSDRCTQTETPILQADSLTKVFCGSETATVPDTQQIKQQHDDQLNARSPSFYASMLAISVLKLMSLSKDIHIPVQEHQQLQLRIAMNSGPCNAGITNLQTATETVRIPHYRFFGHVIYETAKLCSSGLALQIRVGKQCHELLMNAGGFKFERCPDFVSRSTELPVESYWLTGAKSFNHPLPSLDSAVSLSSYDDLM